MKRSRKYAERVNELSAEKRCLSDIQTIEEKLKQVENVGFCENYLLELELTHVFFHLYS
jgi:hypothetical protein